MQLVLIMQIATTFPGSQEDSVSWQTDYAEKPVLNGSQVLSVSGFTAAQMRDRYLEGSESLQETLRSDSGVRYLQ